MTKDNANEPTGLKLRYGSDAADRAEEVARTLVMPPMLEADNTLPADAVVLDVSYHDGHVETDADFEPFID